MTLLDRIRTLIRADAHGLVESLEERSLLLKQNLREAELSLVHKRARADALADEEKRLRDQLDRTEAELGALDDDVTLALDTGEDELARFALRKLLPLRTRRTDLVDQIRERADERSGLEAKLRDQEQRFEALKQRVRAELAARERDPAPSEAWVGPPEVADEEVELELLRRRGARTQGGAA